MASWMVHLRVADELLKQIENLDEQAFVMGNIAPDSCVPNEDWTVFQPPKDVSHFSEKSLNKTINIEKFTSQYFNDQLIKGYSKKEFSFFLGYYTHLLTDIEWANNIYEPLLKTAVSTLRDIIAAAITVTFTEGINILGQSRLMIL